MVKSLENPRLLLSIFSTAILLLTGYSSTVAQSSGGDDFINHGIAVDSGRSHGEAVFEVNGNRMLLLWLHSYNDVSLLAINLDTGESRQFEPDGPPDDFGGPFKSLRASTHKWYAHFSGYFYEFDPQTMEFSYVEETFVRGEVPVRRTTMDMFEDQDGIIWLALFPTAELMSFDPDKRELVNHGALNNESWRQYTNRGLAMDKEGWIYTAIGNVLAQVVGYDTGSGTVRTFLSEDERQHGIGRVFLGEDNNVYATAPGWGWHILEGGEATPVEAPSVGDSILHHGRRSASSDGIPVLTLADGSRITYSDIQNRYLLIEEPDGSQRRVDFDYQSGGALIFTLVNTPSDGIYGSVRRPNNVFRFDVDSGEMETGGFTLEAKARGGFNAVAMQGDTLYGGLYTSGPGLASFVFGQSIHVGNDQKSNPRYYMRAYPEINRPSVLIAHPDQRHIIMGGTPAYGRTGGGLMIYDTVEDEGVVLSHRELVENLSTCAVVALPDGNLVGGTTVQPGTGGVALAEEAQLYLFDWQSRKVVWHEAVLPGRSAILDLISGDGGLIYGMADDSTFFVFDVEKKKLVHEESLSQYGSPAGAQAPRMMVMGPDGTVYLLFRRAIVSLNPETYEHRKLADSPVNAYAGLVLREGRLYFGSGAEIWSYGLPEE